MMLTRPSDPTPMYLLVLAGDGIGPEITAATLSVLRAASERFDLQLRIEEAATGHVGLRAHGHTIHPDIVEKARRADGVVLGPTSTFEFKEPARRGQSVDDAAQKSRSVCQHSACQDLCWLPAALWRVRSRCRAREHRGFLCGSQYGSGQRRGAGDQGCRYFVAPDYTRLQRAHCARGFRVGDDQAQACHDRAQGKCAESD